MTRFELFPQVRRILGGAVLLVTTINLTSTLAVAQSVGPTQLTLVNGWTDAAFGTSHATIEEINGIVQFRGGISGGTVAQAFTVPSGTGLRPSTDVYIPIDLCDGTNGRLHISSSGAASVEAEGGTFSNAQCFTSLDGASYAANATGFTALALINGWTNGPFSTSSAAVRNLYGIVHFKGAIATTGTNLQPFTLPAAFRPAAAVFINVDLCNATKGRLDIGTDGTVTIEASGGMTSNATCFTSLDGVWYALTATNTNFTPIVPLLNGWTNAPFGTSEVEAENAYGMVYFKGAIASGTTGETFVVNPRYRPLTNVYVPVDLCGAAKGRLIIQTSGVVVVEDEGGGFSSAPCFTSLDGVSFVQ